MSLVFNNTNIINNLEYIYVIRKRIMQKGTLFHNILLVYLCTLEFNRTVNVLNLDKAKKKS